MAGITYPPEMLPAGEGKADVIVCNGADCVLIAEVARYRAGIEAIQEYLGASEPRIGDAQWTCDALLAQVTVNKRSCAASQKEKAAHC